MGSIQVCLVMTRAAPLCRRRQMRIGGLDSPPSRANTTKAVTGSAASPFILPPGAGLARRRNKLISAALGVYHAIGVTRHSGADGVVASTGTFQVWQPRTPKYVSDPETEY